jgi:hypothetical protein
MSGQLDASATSAQGERAAGIQWIQVASGFQLVVSGVQKLPYFRNEWKLSAVVSSYYAESAILV